MENAIMAKKPTPAKAHRLDATAPSFERFDEKNEPVRTTQLARGQQRKAGSELFIVDNSDAYWKVPRYARD